MANPFEYFGLFLGSVWDHAFTLLAGCTLTVILQYLDKHGPLKGRMTWQMDLAVVLVFVFFACFQAWHDEHKNTLSVEMEKSSQSALANSCRADLRVEQALYSGSQGLVEDQRKTIDMQQVSNDKQQADISGCLINLARMNPEIRESIHAIPVQIAARGQIVGGQGLNQFLTAIAITTNIREQSFHGKLRCNQPFTIIGYPRIPTEARWLMKSDITPIKISDREYELRIETSNTIWDDQHPSATAVVSTQPMGECSFTKME